MPGRRRLGRMTTSSSVTAAISLVFAPSLKLFLCDRSKRRSSRAHRLHCRGLTDASLIASLRIHGAEHDEADRTSQLHTCR
jgi:hypothetical protein